MKAKNLYYHTVFQRTNAIKLLILQIFIAVASWGRIFIEVFTRKHFGERYFLLPLNLFFAGLLGLIPTLWTYEMPFLRVVTTNLTWYAYVAAFIVASFRRWLEVLREPGVYDFKKFTLSPGIINSGFYKLELFNLNITNRLLATFVEPGLFLIIGFLLISFDQNIGYLLIGSSIIYAGSWAGQYHLGDHFIMDIIDKKIANEELANSFIHNRLPGQTRGFEADGSKIKSREFRRQLADDMIEDEPAAEVI